MLATGPVRSAPTPLQAFVILTSIAALVWLGAACGGNWNPPQPPPPPDAKPIIPGVDRPYYLFAQHRDVVLTLAFSPDGSTLVSGARDGEIIRWSVRGGALGGFLTRQHSAVTTVAFSPDGRWLASGTTGGQLVLWDTSVWRAVTTIGTVPDLRSVAFSPDSRTLVAGMGDGSATLYEVPTGAAMRVFRGHSGGVNRVAFSLDSSHFYSAGDDGTVRAWDIAAGTSTMIAHHQLPVAALAVSPRTGVVASADNARIYFTERDGSHVEVDSAPCADLVFSLDGQHLLAVNAIGGLEYFSPRKSYPYHRHTASLSELHALAISPDGKLVATAGNDEAVRLWKY